MHSPLAARCLHAARLQRAPLLLRHFALAALLASGAFAQPQNIEVSPRSLDFGTVELGQTSRAMEVRVENTGGIQLFIQSVRTTDQVFRLPNPQGFSNFPIGPGQFWIGEVRFRPGQEGEARGDLVIRSNDPDQPVVRVRLQGRTPVRSPRLVVTPNAIDFGELFVDDEGLATLELANQGNQQLVIERLTLPSTEFGISQEGMTPLQLGPDESRLLELSFRPPVAGNFAATLTIESTDPDQRVARVPLQGSGRRRPIDFEVEAMPDSLRLIPGRVARVRYRVEELASRDLQVTSSADQLWLRLRDGRALPLRASPLNARLAANDIVELEDTVLLPLELYDAEPAALEGALLQRTFSGSNQGTTLRRDAAIEVSLTGALGAEFQVTTVAVDYPFENTTIAAGESLRARILVYGTGTGTALGTVLVDGIAVEHFVAELVNGRTETVELLNTLPTGRVGSHQVYVMLREPHGLQSRPVRYLVTPRDIEPLRFINELGSRNYLRGQGLPAWSWTPRAGALGYRVLIDGIEVARTERSRWRATEPTFARLEPGAHRIEVAPFYFERSPSELSDDDLRRDLASSAFGWRNEPAVLNPTCQGTNCSWASAAIVDDNGNELYAVAIANPGGTVLRRLTQEPGIDLTSLGVDRACGDAAGPCTWHIEQLNDLGQAFARSAPRPLETPGASP